MEQHRVARNLLALAILALSCASPGRAQLPEGFKAVDVGGPAEAGSTTVQNGLWTVKGSGDYPDSAAAESFHFAHRVV